jgi:hypothetical protein
MRRDIAVVCAVVAALGARLDARAGETPLYEFRADFDVRTVESRDVLVALGDRTPRPSRRCGTSDTRSTSTG